MEDTNSQQENPLRMTPKRPRVRPLGPDGMTGPTITAQASQTPTVQKFVGNKMPPAEDWSQLVPASTVQAKSVLACHDRQRDPRDLLSLSGCSSPDICRLHFFGPLPMGIHSTCLSLPCQRGFVGSWLHCGYSVAAPERVPRSSCWHFDFRQPGLCNGAMKPWRNQGNRPRVQPQQVNE